MSILSISPIDGRYRSKTEILSGYFSEKALIRYRVFVEVNYLLSLSEEGVVGLRKFSDEEKKILIEITDISEEDAEIVKAIETKGYVDIPATNHDVKAVEYFIKLKLKKTSLSDVLEYVHFCLTSEDINNLSYSLMLKDGFNEVIYKEILKLSATDGSSSVSFTNTTDYKDVLIINEGDYVVYIAFSDTATTDDFKLNSGEYISVNTSKYQISGICNSGETTTIKILGVY